MPATLNFSGFEFLFFQKTEEAAARREKLADLEECRQISERVELELAAVKFLIERAKDETEKLDTADTKKLLKSMTKTLKRAKKSSDLADVARDKLDFQQ